MPIPYTPPIPPPPPSTPVQEPVTPLASRRFHRPDRQSYAIDQARDRHTEVLYRRGEYAMFVLMWTVHDHQVGRVNRCPICVERFGDDVVQAFGGQPAQDKCPACLGTGMEGGWKAKLIRPSLWTIEMSDDEVQAKRGTYEQQAANIQSTFDFTMNRGDFVLRADGTRWFVRAPRTALLAEGSGVLTDGAASLGFNYAGANREPLNSVAFLIDPEPDEIITILQPPGHRMVDFSAQEIVRRGAVLV
jgi:hypothetical protein